MDKEYTPEERRAEAVKDVGKETLTLVEDVYEELLKPEHERVMPENARHAAKRFAGLLGKHAIEMEESSKQSIALQGKMDAMTSKLVALTERIMRLTVITMLLATIAAIPLFIAFGKFVLEVFSRLYE